MQQMLNDMNTQFLADRLKFSARPVIIDRVSEELVFYGYCLPNCKGYDEPKWLIQMWTKTDTIEQIAYPLGLREYTQKWTERASLKYKLAPQCGMTGAGLGADYNKDFNNDFKID